MGNTRAVLLLTAGVLTLPGGLLADQVTFTHTGAGASGTIGGVPFSDAPFVFTAIGDTANIESIGNGFSLDHSSASVTIGGVGTFDFISGTRTFVAGGFLVGFSRATLAGSDLYNGPADDGLFAGYDLTTSIGPIVGNGSLFQWAQAPFMETTGGTLVFNGGSTAATFTADVVVPAPAGAGGMLLAFGAAASRRRR